MTATAGRIEKPERKREEREGVEVTASQSQTVPLIEAAITLWKHAVELERLPPFQEYSRREGQAMKWYPDNISLDLRF